MRCGPFLRNLVWQRDVWCPGRKPYHCEKVQGLTFLERTGGKRGVGGRYPIVDVRVNGKPFAEGEVVTIGEAYGVRLTDILNHDLE